MTALDAQWMLETLRHGPATTSELIDWSKAERGVRLTPHSRASDLRKRGYDIQVRRRPGHGRPVYEYTLVQGAGRVEPPARGHAAQGAEIPAPVPDVIPGQLRLVG